MILGFLKKLFKSKRFNIILVPANESNIKTFPMHSYWLMTILVLSILGLLSVFIVFVDYLSLFKNMVENRAIKMENIKLKEELSNVASKIKSLDENVYKLNFFAQKLKMMTNSTEQNPSTENKAEYTLPPMVDEVPIDNKNENAAGDNIPHFSQEKLIEDPNLDESYTDWPNINFQQLQKKLFQLNEKSNLVEKDFSQLEGLIEKNLAMLASIPNIKPCHGWVSGAFGYRISPYDQSRVFHNGQDIAAPVGTSIYSPADGLVTFASVQPGYGRVVVLDHGFGYVTRYGHVSRILVQVGQKIVRGMKIAEVGNTGRSTGPHLHYEVLKKGIPMNPALFMDPTI